MMDVPKETVVQNGFRVGISVDRNRRKTMEDAHTYICNYNNVPGQGFFAIYDGHVNERAAQHCCKRLHKNLSELLTSDEKKGTDVLELMNESFVQTDRELEKNKEEIRFSGCTAAVSYIQAGESKRTLFTGNVGDTRVVLCRQGVANRLTYDHKGVDENEQKRIEQGGGMVMNGRVNGMLAVTRSLGDCQLKEFVVGNPYTAQKDLAEGDMLIIACDGLWDVCEDQQAYDLIKEIEDPKEASDTLLKFAIESYSQDNISIMVIHFTEDWSTSKDKTSISPTVQ